MAIPGFTAERSAGASRGDYVGRFSNSPPPGSIRQQMRRGGWGASSSCCCTTSSGGQNCIEGGCDAGCSCGCSGSTAICVCKTGFSGGFLARA
jgi:hypothetical protein